MENCEVSSFSPLGTWRNKITQLNKNIIQLAICTLLMTEFTKAKNMNFQSMSWMISSRRESGEYSGSWVHSANKGTWTHNTLALLVRKELRSQSAQRVPMAYPTSELLLLRFYGMRWLKQVIMQHKALLAAQHFLGFKWSQVWKSILRHGSWVLL